MASLPAVSMTIRSSSPVRLSRRRTLREVEQVNLQLSQQLAEVSA